MGKKIIRGGEMPRQEITKLLAKLVRRCGGHQPGMTSYEIVRPLVERIAPSPDLLWFGAAAAKKAFLRHVPQLSAWLKQDAETPGSNPSEARRHIKPASNAQRPSATVAPTHRKNKTGHTSVHAVRHIISKCRVDPRSDAFLQTFEWRALRMMALKKHGGACQCCGAIPATGAILNVDHIKPRKYYPELALHLDNLQVLCGLCNHGKGSWDTTDWRETQEAEPHLPRAAGE